MLNCIAAWRILFDIFTKKSVDWSCTADGDDNDCRYVFVSHFPRVLANLCAKIALKIKSYKNDNMSMGSSFWIPTNYNIIGLM